MMNIICTLRKNIFHIEEIKEVLNNCLQTLLLKLGKIFTRHKKRVIQN